MVSKPLIAQGYSLAEEIANSISHGIGLVFGIVGLVLLLVQAVDTNASAMAITSYSLYGGSMILLFLASTLYHAIPHQRAKIWLKKFDHCAIYLLIAGTYTPFLLVGLNSPLSRGLMIVIWSLALLGILFKLTIAHRFKVLSLVTYLTMGWLSLIVVYQLAIKLAAGGVTLLAVGDGDLGQRHARALDLLGGGHHLGGPVDDLQAVLVDAQAFEQQMMVVLEALGAGDGDREGVADGDRAPELEGLAHIDGAGAGEFGAEDGRDQHAAPHGVAHHLAELARAGKLGVDVGRVDIARHHRKQVDVLGAQGADQVGGVADGDLVEGPVLDEIVGFDGHGSFLNSAMQQWDCTETV